MGKKYRIKEYLIFHWDVGLLDFTKPQSHMEWHIEERKNILFWKTIKIFTCQKLAQRKFNDFYVL